jgi:hypothetical protein
VIEDEIGHAQTVEPNDVAMCCSDSSGANLDVVHAIRAQPVDK